MHGTERSEEEADVDADEKDGSYDQREVVIDISNDCVEKALYRKQVQLVVANFTIAPLILKLLLKLLFKA